MTWNGDYYIYSKDDIEMIDQYGGTQYSRDANERLLERMDLNGACKALGKSRAWLKEHEYQQLADYLNGDK